MIDLYFFPTPNGNKVTIFLEEAGLDYQVKPVHLLRGEQTAADFVAISPNGRIPAIVDHAPADGGGPLAIFESGAILQYLAEKSGQLLPQDVRGRAAVSQWLFWQMAGLGPTAGQNHHFQRAAKAIPYAIKRYVDETARLYGVLDHALAANAYVAGDSFSIADIAIYPWVVPHAVQQQDLADFPHLKRWFDTLGQRPSVVRAYAIAEDYKPASA